MKFRSNYATNALAEATHCEQWGHRLADESDRRYRAWIRRPARPIWYGPVARWLDWRNGRRDGRHGLPVVWDSLSAPLPSTEDGESRQVDAGLTHYALELGGRFGGAAAAEEVRWEARRGLLQPDLVRARKLAVDRRRRLSDLEADLKEKSEPPTEEALAVRTTVEIERDRPEYVTRRRRSVAHGRVRRLADERVQAAEEACRTAEVAVDDLTERSNAEWRVAAARVKRLHEHYRRRMANYWRHVIARHEHGGELNRRLRPAGPDLPAWVRDAPEPGARNGAATATTTGTGTGAFTRRDA